jgi:insulin receptor
MVDFHYFFAPKVAFFFSKSAKKNLTGCSIIEGHLIISGFKDDQALTNLSFPELREVTEYVIFYQAQNIVKLNHLFPNLSVIRGNKLVAVR